MTVFNIYNDVYTHAQTHHTCTQHDIRPNKLRTQLHFRHTPITFFLAILPEVILQGFCKNVNFAISHAIIR